MSATSPTTLWTPELASETQVWMRYLTFRPWYEDKAIAIVGGSDPFGAHYSSFLATSVEFYTTDESSAEGQAGHYGVIRTEPETVPASRYDVVLCFDALNNVQDPHRLLQNLSMCEGKIAVGYMPDGKWSFAGFSAAVEDAFDGRSIRFFFQQPTWPFRLTSQEAPNALMWVAVIGEDTPIAWPSVGLSMPTVDNPTCVQDAVLGLTRCYPGEMQIAVVANGSTQETMDQLLAIGGELDNLVNVVQNETNLGYGQGCNRGLEILRDEGQFDYYGVVNDDVLPDADCLCELVAGICGLEDLNLNPGVIGPVSNYVNGAQQVDVGAFHSYSELLDRVAFYRRTQHSSVTQVRQIRGLLLLIHPHCLETVGGFDPIFGLGNFEDDDHNLRTHLAGFSLWIADGAFLYHHGSTTFRQLEVDYEANINRNSEALRKKWCLRRSSDDWLTIAEIPEGVSLKVELDSWRETHVDDVIVINGESVDLVRQASEMEFAAWVMSAMRKHPREFRRSVIELIRNGEIQQSAA